MRLYYKWVNNGWKVDDYFTCYAGWTAQENKDCATKDVRYWNDLDSHVWECLNYKVFWCWDWLINRPDWATDYYNWSYTEQCDPNHPDWKNWKDGQSCNPNTCKIEYEAPVCSSEYTNKKVYTSNSTPYLKGLDSENLCSLWNLTPNTFKQI